MKISRSRIAILTTLILILTGCGPALPTQIVDPGSLVQTIVAATVAVLPTSTLAPTRTPEVQINLAMGVSTESPSNLYSTSTPIPTLTPLSFPTNTPGATLPASAKNGGKVMYSCEELVLKPERGAQVYPHELIQMVWKVENTGTAVWYEKDVKFMFIAGDKIYKEVSESELGYSVYPDARIRVQVMLVAPQEPGRYSAAWGLKMGEHLICSMEMYFDVIPRPPSPTPTPKVKK